MGRLSRPLLLASLLLGAVVALAVSSLAEAKTVYVGGKKGLNPWGPMVQHWRPPVVQSDDVLVFRWARPANIILSEFGPNAFFWTDYLLCRYRRIMSSTMSGNVMLHNTTKKGTFKYTVPRNFIGTMTFFSVEGNACQKGTKVAFPWVIYKAP